MKKQLVESIVPITQEEEVNQLLNSLRPYRFTFIDFIEERDLTEGNIIVQLNEEQTKLIILIPGHNQYGGGMAIERDSRIISNDLYDRVRTALQEDLEISNPELVREAEQSISIGLKGIGQLEDREGFLEAYRQFIIGLPEVSVELQNYLNELVNLDIDNLDIDESDENSPNLKKLEELHKKMRASLGLYQASAEEYIKKRSEREEEIQKEDIDIENLAELEFRKRYPEQSRRIERVFEILNELKMENRLSEVDKIAKILGLPEEKLKSYFQARIKMSGKRWELSVNQKINPIFMVRDDYWYSDDDMDRLGRRLEKYGVDVEKQYKGRLTKDVINSLPAAEDRVDAKGDIIKGLEEGKPIFISYNIGGSAAEDGGIHWVAIVLVKHNGVINVLYKDSKGDFEGNAAEVERSFREHYGETMQFIRHEGVEQEDGSSCGPMTISNLEKIAKKIEDEGIDALVKSFHEIPFTRQDEVAGVRSEHAGLIVNLSTSKSITKESNLKTAEKIIEELKLINKDEEELKDEIREAIEKIDKAYDAVKEWGVSELATWSAEHKGRLDKISPDAICNAIAVMERANELATGGHKLRDTQKVAIFIFMKNEDKGHISQISTGEGKTTIVSFVQALKVMQGYKGHVITSNEVLAAEGVKNKKVFYDLLGISVAHNNVDEKYVDGAKACYAQDIVYGSINNFQFDWLRDSFERLETMGGLNFNQVWVMLDEIDSLLIDQGGNIAKLSGPFPGMESLRYAYINIWAALAQSEIKAEEEILADLKGKAEELSAKELQFKEELYKKYEEILADGVADAGITDPNIAKLKLLTDDEAVKADLAKLEELEETNHREYEEFEDELRESFLDKIKEKVKAQKDSLINKSITAKHLHEYAERSVERWIEYAFAAKYQYSENVEYKIVQDKNGERIIIPVDNQNTGVSMKNTILSNGLHQFLQIKHNLCLTYESLTSSYISNLGYILNQYVNQNAEGKVEKCRVSGVTGTLGSDAERDLLGEVFTLEFSVIPTYKPKQFEAFPGRIVADDEFVNTVAVSALSEIIRDRASLIVCASIRDVEAITQAIRKEASGAGLNPRIKIYRDEADAHVTEATLDFGDIVIATNIAGRGTDFKTSDDLEENGGLHVIKAFLPCNKRVEDQGLGRTSRQGNYGTGQIIARISELEELGIIFDDEDFDFEEIIEQRDQLEIRRVSDIRVNKVIELKFKDQLFNKFKELYGGLKDIHKVDGDPRWSYVLNDLKEKWAFWLEEQEYTTEKVQALGGVEQVAREFAKFREKSEEIIAGNIRHNPFYSICLAERYLEAGDKESRVKAKTELDNALTIGNDSELLYSAHMKLFEVAIENGGQTLERYKKAVAKVFFISVDKDENYKIIALEQLRKAKAALTKEHTYLEELITGKADVDDGRGVEEHKDSEEVIKRREDSQIQTVSSVLDSILIPPVLKAEVSMDYWYSDEDMDRLGRRLEKYGVDVEKQFKGRLTKDVIGSLPAAEDRVDAKGDIIKGLEEGKPIFISYNIGGSAERDGGIHWVAIVLVKHNGVTNVLYKDSKGDFEGNAAEVERSSREHYGETMQFIRHEGVEQEDGSSCGPMTISNLEKIAKKIEDEGIDALVKSFREIPFIRQDQVAEVRSKHAELLGKIVQDETNVFVKHLKARQVVLGVYLGNIDSLIGQIEGPEALKDGIIIDTKVPRYLSKLDPKLDHEKQLKEAITDKEVNELEFVGMNSIIQMREVHDVPDKVIENAQWQIAGGLAALAVTIPFPFLLPINGPIAGALISEGITDIIMALIDQGQVGFSKQDYVKGKLISYGISIVTMGIGAIASSTKILTKAMNACKSLANKLRAVEGPFAKVCNWMAGKLDKLANYLELCIKKIEMAKKGMDAQKQMLTGLHKEAAAAQKLGDIEKFNKLTNQLQQLNKLTKVSDIALTHGQKLVQILKTTAIGALKGVAVSVAMEKICTATLNNIMAGLKPQIKEKVKEAVAAKINAEQARLAKYSQETINKQIQAVFETSLNEDIEHVAKEISLGVLRHSNNWKMQLIVLALDSLISGIDIAACADRICSKFLAGLPALPEEAASYQHNYEQIISRLGVQISDMVYGKIVAITGKVMVTLPKALYRGYKQHKEKIADKQTVELMKKRIEEVSSAEKSATTKGTDCGHNAVAASLGVDNEHLAHSSGLAMSTEGASKEDINRLYSQNGIATTECSVIDAVEQLGKCESDRAVVCLKRDGDNIGHAVPVTLEGGQLMVTEKGKKISLDAYRVKNGYSADASIIIPIGVNAEKIADGSISRITNHNRIAKVAHPIDYVGQDGQIKFGAATVSFDTAPGHEPTKGSNKSSRFKLRTDEGSIPDGTNNPAHARRDHVGHVDGKSTFKTKNDQDKYLATVRKGESTTERNKRVTTAKLDKPYEGYDSGKRKKFTHVKLVEYYNSDGSWTIQTFYPCNEKHQGTNQSSLTTIEGISAHFYEYTMEGIGDILGLRLCAETSTGGLTNTLVLPETYIFSEKYSNIQVLLFYLNLYVITLMLYRNKHFMSRVSPPAILAPISLYGKHAVGVMFVAQEDGSGYKAFYLDPENTTIPEGLATIFKDNGYEIEQLPTEGQRYTNCGPEVIENFMLYLTGERLSQEDAIVNNSRLVEQELLSSSHDAEEASCLTLKDSYSKEDAVTVISNTAYNTQVTSDGYIIGNPTRYDIVTPQTIIDGVVVRADPGREPSDVLLELVHDYRINQDYPEVILGEVTSIDIS